MSLVRNNKEPCALLIGFLGTDFSGLVQNVDKRTVVGEVIKSLIKIGAMPAVPRSDRNSELSISSVEIPSIIKREQFFFPNHDLKSSSRTDAGVSAVSVVLVGNLQWVRDTQNSNEVTEYSRVAPHVMRELPKYLPPDIVLLGVKRVSPSFDPRRNASARHYVYTIPISKILRCTISQAFLRARKYYKVIVQELLARWLKLDCRQQVIHYLWDCISGWPVYCPADINKTKEVNFINPLLKINSTTASLLGQDTCYINTLQSKCIESINFLSIGTQLGLKDEDNPIIESENINVLSGYIKKKTNKQRIAISGIYKRSKFIKSEHHVDYSEIRFPEINGPVLNLAEKMRYSNDKSSNKPNSISSSILGSTVLLMDERFCIVPPAIEAENISSLQAETIFNIIVTALYHRLYESSINSASTLWSWTLKGKTLWDHILENKPISSITGEEKKKLSKEQKAARLASAPSYQENESIEIKNMLNNLLTWYSLVSNINKSKKLNNIEPNNLNENIYNKSCDTEENQKLNNICNIKGNNLVENTTSSLTNDNREFDSHQNSQNNTYISDTVSLSTRSLFSLFNKVFSLETDINNYRFNKYFSLEINRLINLINLEYAADKCIKNYIKLGRYNNFVGAKAGIGNGKAESVIYNASARSLRVDNGEFFSVLQTNYISDNCNNNSLEEKKSDTTEAINNYLLDQSILNQSIEKLCEESKKHLVFHLVGSHFFYNQIRYMIGGIISVLGLITPPVDLAMISQDKKYISPEIVSWISQYSMEDLMHSIERIERKKVICSSFADIFLLREYKKPILAEPQGLYLAHTEYGNNNTRAQNVILTSLKHKSTGLLDSFSDQDTYLSEYNERYKSVEIDVFREAANNSAKCDWIKLLGQFQRRLLTGYRYIASCDKVEVNVDFNEKPIDNISIYRHRPVRLRLSKVLWPNFTLAIKQKTILNYKQKIASLININANFVNTGKLNITELVNFHKELEKDIIPYNQSVESNFISAISSYIKSIDTDSSYDLDILLPSYESHSVMDFSVNNILTLLTSSKKQKSKRQFYRSQSNNIFHPNARQINTMSISNLKRTKNEGIISDVVFPDELSINEDSIKNNDSKVTITGKKTKLFSFDAESNSRIASASWLPVIVDSEKSSGLNGWSGGSPKPKVNTTSCAANWNSMSLTDFLTLKINSYEDFQHQIKIAQINSELSIACLPVENTPGVIVIHRPKKNRNSGFNIMKCGRIGGLMIKVIGNLGKKLINDEKINSVNIGTVRFEYLWEMILINNSFKVCEAIYPSQNHIAWLTKTIWYYYNRLEMGNDFICNKQNIDILPYLHPLIPIPKLKFTDPYFSMIMGLTLAAWSRATGDAPSNAFYTGFSHNLGLKYGINGGKVLHWITLLCSLLGQLKIESNDELIKVIELGKDITKYYDSVTRDSCNVLTKAKLQLAIEQNFVDPSTYIGKLKNNKSQVPKNVNMV